MEMLFPQEQMEDAAQTAGPDATAGGGAGRARVSSNPRPAESVPTCYNCDQPGHKVRDCPLPKNEKKVRMKVPTLPTQQGERFLSGLSELSRGMGSHRGVRRRLEPQAGT